MSADVLSLVAWDRTLVRLALIVLGTTAFMFPLIRYVHVGWSAKRKDIMDGVAPDARACYFLMFGRVEGKLSQEEASSRFVNLYDEWYGRKFFYWPGALLLCSGLLAVTAVVCTGLERLNYAKNPFFTLPDTALAAIAGAYLWIVHDHISRARRLDFSPADVLWAVLRLVIAIPMGYAFGSILNPANAKFVAFAIGAFPLSGLLAIMRKLSGKYLDLGDSSETGTDGVINLHGVNKQIAERLAQEDITSVTQIAYCDPVRVVMRSNLSFNYVTDCMNQALAWLYLEDGLNKLRPLSLRGAVEISNLIEQLDEPLMRDKTRSALQLMAETVSQKPDTFEVTLREIAEDPYTIFLRRVWFNVGLSETPSTTLASSGDMSAGNVGSPCSPQKTETPTQHSGSTAQDRLR